MQKSSDISNNFKTYKMKRQLTMVAALAASLVFAQQTQENDSIIVTDLDEVVVSSGRGTVDLASTRITPMAVNIVSQEEIQNKIDQNDLTAILVNTPSVFVNNQAGGFGDTEIFVRGFNQANTAFLLNGQPVNAAEDGKMYWSNWSGLGDVTQAVEIQRGLGASKLAINSVGGTVNFIMKATKISKSNTATLTLGSDNYRKGTYAVNTGLMENGSAFSALIGYWQGDGYAEGTYGKGQTYFFSYGKKLSYKFEMNALLTGAPQWHDQAFEQSLADYLVHGQRYNQWWGVNEDGSYNTTERNNYHKPVFNLTFDYQIDDVSSLSAVFYGSFGRGGGTGDRGNILYTSDGQVDFAELERINKTEVINGGYQAGVAGPSPTGDRGFIVRNSMNLHNWFGSVINYEKKISDNATFDAGVDLRTYYGKHFRVVEDMVGLTSWTERSNARDELPLVTRDESFPITVWKQTFANYNNAERISYSNDENINYAGIYAQLEHADDDFSAFAQGSLSGQSYVRFEDWNETYENRQSESLTKYGYNIKGGVSFNLNENSKVFINAGIYSRQPFLDNVFLNYSNFLNPLAENEKVTSYEIGYRYASSNFSLNLDLYSTNWTNRIRSSRDSSYGPDNGLPGEFLRITSGLEQQHEGAELYATYQPNQFLTFRGYASIGDWTYVGTAVTAIRNDDNVIVQENASVDVDGGKVGGGAQTQVGLGTILKISNMTSIDFDWRFNDDLYGIGRESKTNIKIPAFKVADMGVTHKLMVADSKLLTLRLNVTNLFNTEYLSYLFPADEGDYTGMQYMGLDTAHEGRFGTLRRFSLGFRYTF